jgi:trehalose-6-phosphatase
VLDADAPWVYNTLEFTTVRNNIEVRCRIVSSYGKITTRLMMGSQELAKFELRIGNDPSHCERTPRGFGSDFHAEAASR